MQLRRAAALAAGALLVASAGSAQAGEGNGWDYALGEYCTNATPECVQDAAMSYLTALRQHDGDYARLAPTITRSLNGSEPTTYTRDELAESLDDSEDPINSVHADDWVVDGDNAVAFYAIDASYAERGAAVANTWLAERFHITNGEIDEIEGVFIFAPGPPNTDRGWLRGQPVADPGSDRAALEAIARRLLDAQASGDYSDAPLAQEVRRTFNGKETGRTRPVVETVTAPFGPWTTGVRDERFFVDSRTGEVAGFATVDHAGGSLLLAQRFRISGGLVTEIEQIAFPDGVL